MYTISHDYYAIMGVSKNATLEEIKGQYKRLMKENHPDKYNGLKAKYGQEEDKTLLKLLEEKIREAEEFCKLLNEAFAVLSDSAKRKQYDNETIETKIEEPKISISPKTISFGTLKDGEKRSSTFTIKNDGGPAAGVNIDWEGAKPVWGDLIIEPDENNTFPIKVMISANTAGIPSGAKDDKILVTVDGKVQTVEVFLSIRIPKTVSSPVPTPTHVPTPGSTHSGPKTSGCATFVVGLLVIGSLLAALFIIGGNVLGQANQKNVQATAIANTNATATAIEMTEMVHNLIPTAAPLPKLDDFLKISNFEHNSPSSGEYVEFKATNVSKQVIDLLAWEGTALCSFGGKIGPGESHDIHCTSPTWYSFLVVLKTANGFCWEFDPT